MSESASFTWKPKENFLSAFSAGAFLILVGAIFIATPNFFDSVLNFLKDFGIVEVPNIFPGFFLPAPKNPADHTIVYSAAMHFCLAWGIFLIGMLFIRVLVGSPLQKKAENASDIVFWLGSSFLITEFLNNAITPTEWFTFWTTIIMLIGATLVLRGLLLAIFKVKTLNA